MSTKLLLVSLCLLLVGSVIPQIEVSASEAEDITVYTEYITGEELIDLQDYMVSNTVNNMRAGYGINWTVPANTRYKTGSFSKNANNAITVTLRLSATGRAGIMGFDGRMDYVTGTSIGWNFTTWSSQTYCVFVQNNSSSSITATGSYSY